jgi:hypothetical protein
MARAFGRLYSRMWAPGSGFANLGPLEQRLYMFLSSQPNLNHAGVLPITLRRWATMTVGLAPKQIEQQLRALEDARWIVLDWDQEELLISTHILDDEVWKQPRVMGAAVASALEVGSPRLRQALLAQVECIPLEELSDDSGPRDSPSVRRQVEDHIATLRLAFRPDAPCEIPAGGLPAGAAEALGSPSAGVGDGVTEGSRQGSTRVGARVFSPSTSPVDNSTGADAAPDAAGAAQETKSKGKPRKPKSYVAPRFAEFYAAYPRKTAPADAEAAWTKAVDEVKADPQLIIDAAKLFAMASRTKEAKWIPHPATWLNRRSWEDEPERAPDAPSAIGAPSVAAAAAPRPLAAVLAEQRDHGSTGFRPPPGDEDLLTHIGMSVDDR